MTKFVVWDIDDACNLNAILFKTFRNGRRVLPEKLGEFSMPMREKNSKQKFFDFALANEADILLKYNFPIGYLDFLCGDNTLLHDYNSFLVFDVRQMSTELCLNDYRLSSVAQDLGIELNGNNCEVIMNIFTRIWEMRTLTYAPYYYVEENEKV